MSSAIYDIALRRIDGEPASLADYAGDVVLVVNVASKCGFTPQYTSLEKAFQAERARGLVVLGFPSNEFGNQEPGTNADIAQFCSTTYDVTFPLFEKIEVNGAARHPLYGMLIAAQPEATAKSSAFRDELAGYGVRPANPDDVLWNFEKFLISRQGRVVGRFASDVSVDDPVLREAIALELSLV
jgi:glutathione peroxidase